MLPLCDQHCNQRAVPWPPNTQSSLPDAHSPNPQHLATPDAFCLYIIKCHRKGVRKESHCIWLYLLSIMRLRSIHGSTWISDLFVPILSDSPWMFCLLIRLPVERHLNGFPLLVFINKVTISRHIQLLCEWKSSFLLGINTWDQITESCVSICLTL